MRLKVRSVLRAIVYTALWFAAYFFVSGLAMSAQGQQIVCKPIGRDFKCVSIGAEHLKIYPRWILHTKPARESFGLDSPQWRTPKRWTYVTADFYPYDEDIKRVQACLEVALIRGVTYLREPCTKPERK